MSWLVWTALAVGGFVSIVGGAFFWGMLRHKKEVWDLGRMADDALEAKKHAEKTAEIFAAPSGDKPDIVNRL